MITSKSLRSILIFALLLLVGCAPASAPAPQPTATLPPVVTQPTATTQPTGTTQPTAATAPTVTNQPLRTPLPAGIESLDMTDIQSNLEQGFWKSFIAGNYAYFVPTNFSGSQVKGLVIRVDLNNFTPAGATVLNVKQSVYGGFLNSFTDGRYGFFVDVDPVHSDAYRVDLQNFTPSGITLLSLEKVNPDLVSSAGVFTGGQYAYFASGFSDVIITRVDMQNFDQKNMATLNIKNYYEGCVIGQYGYLATDANMNSTATSIARIDLHNFTPDGITYLDLGEGYRTVVGGWFCDENYFYLAPLESPQILRFDTRNFSSDGVTAISLANVDGYNSAFSDGHYGYFFPFYPDSMGGTGKKIARVDLTSFTVSAVTYLDLTQFNPGWNNFVDGMADSHFIYLEPGNTSPQGMPLNTSVVRISLDYAGWTALP